MSSNNLVISMTSWKGRINYVPRVINSIMSNIVKPDNIYLNLSEEEFVNKESDLSSDLVDLVNRNLVSINWVGRNTKTLKKLIPVIKNNFDNKELKVITIDDDIIYEPYFIRDMLIASDNNPNSVIVWKKYEMSFHDQPVPNGRGSLYKVKFFSDLLFNGLTEEVISTNEDDWWYAFCMLVNGPIDVKYLGGKFKNIRDTQGVKAEYDTFNTIKVLDSLLQRIS